MHPIYTRHTPGLPVIFVSQLEFLPDFWEDGLETQQQAQRLENVMQRQREFVRMLGFLPVEANIELRIMVEPAGVNPIRIAYIVSVPVADAVHDVWHSFHSAFPADLDFRPQPILAERVHLFQDPLGGQAKHFYEWRQVPEIVQLPDEDRYVKGLPEYRADQSVQLLRILAQQSQPLVLGFTVRPIPLEDKANEHSQRIEYAKDYWYSLLKDLETIERLLGVPGGDTETRERFQPVLDSILDRNIEQQERNILWDILSKEYIRDGINISPNHILRLVQTTALRSLSAGRHYLWRVHAATVQPLSTVVAAAVSDELGRSSEPLMRRTYRCVDITDNIESSALYEQISAESWQDWPDTPQEYIPNGEYIDEEAATALLSLPILPQGGIPGIRTYPANPFSAWQLIESMSHESSQSDTSTSRSDLSLSDMVIGDYIDRRATIVNPRYQGVTIPVNDLTRHALITGSTGAGKSTTCKRILVELGHRNIPFLVVEPVKDEYGDLAFAPDFANDQDLEYHRLGAPTDGLWLNPFYIRKGVSLNTHLSYLQSAFMAALPLFPWMEPILKRVLYQAYLHKARKVQTSREERKLPPRKYGFEVKDGKPEAKDGKSLKEFREYLAEKAAVPVSEVLTDDDFPTLADIIEVAEPLITRIGYQGEALSNVRSAILMRLGSLNQGVVGALLTKRIGTPSFEARIEQLLEQPTVLQLSAIADKDEKALVMGFILTALYEYYETQPTSPKLKHVTLVEEAHILLENTARVSDKESVSSRAKAIELFVDMLAEVRSRGEGFIIAEQLPSKLVSEAIKNTNLKIMHRLTAREDREVLGSAMSLNDRQSRFATTLEQGQAIIFREGLTEPALASIKRAHVPDDERPYITNVINALYLGTSGTTHQWPKPILNARDKFKSDKSRANALALSHAFKAWLNALDVVNPTPFAILWAAKTLHSESPQYFDYARFKQLLLMN